MQNTINGFQFTIIRSIRLSRHFPFFQFLGLPNQNKIIANYKQKMNNIICRFTEKKWF